MRKDMGTTRAEEALTSGAPGGATTGDRRPAALHAGDIEARLKQERENAALICEDLAARWRASAARTRKEGTFTNGWPFYRTFVAKGYERCAKDIEQAAHGLEAVASIIRSGARALNAPHTGPMTAPPDEPTHLHREPNLIP